MLAPVAFRFEADGHKYFIENERRPSITQLLEVSGWSDPRWFTEESRRRGTAVHDITAQMDLAGLDAESVDAYKGYAIAYQAMRDRLRPTWHAIEEAEMEPQWRFGGRPDRVGMVFGARTIVELKSGVKTKAHPIQTALQAKLVSWRYGVPPTLWQRITVYLKPNGKYDVHVHTDNREHYEAEDILKEHCK